MTLKRKIRLTIILLGVSLLLVWALFYFYTTRNLSRSAEQNMQRTAEQILDRLEVDFLKLEGIAFSLAAKPVTLSFITEEDPTAYLIKSGGVDRLADDVISPADTVGHLITYTTEGVYSRFVGALGNTAAARLYHTLSASALPGYFGVTLEGAHYLCYATDIRQGGEPVGVIALLVDAGELLAVGLEESDYQVSLSSGGRVIASGEAGYIGLDTAQLIALSELHQRRSVGFAPFEILVTVGQGYFSSAYIEFIIAEAVIAAVFTAILISFLRVSNRHLFQPMLQVIHGVEGLGQSETPARLEKTGAESFDVLVEQVNRMLDRLEELQEIRLDRQKALVVSLKKQINAHFTVNILNVINQLARQGEMEKAQAMTAGLSSLLQYVNSGDEYIDAMEELQILRKYAAMMQIRYRREFGAEFDWDDRLMGVDIPRMLVQPLLENAIEHGLDLLRDGGAILVRGELGADAVRFTVADNGRGMKPEALSRLRRQLETVETDAWEASGISSIALVNIQRRVRSYYGRDWGLTIESRTGEGTTVTLRLPRDKKRSEPDV